MNDYRELTPYERNVLDSVPIGLKINRDSTFEFDRTELKDAVRMLICRAIISSKNDIEMNEYIDFFDYDERIIAMPDRLGENLAKARISLYKTQINKLNKYLK